MKLILNETCPRYQVTFPKAKKGEPAVRPMKEKVTYSKQGENIVPNAKSICPGADPGYSKRGGVDLGDGPWPIVS